MKVKALRNCMFSYEGATYRTKKGEELDVDVPLEVLDSKSFEVLEAEGKKKKSKPKESEEVNENG